MTGPDDRREVAASSFDEPASRHVALAEIVTETRPPHGRGRRRRPSS